MRSNLEKAIVHLLNEENDKAEALFHKFMVERARQIHESLRQGEDLVLEEGWDEEITTESYFTEDDLEGLEDGGDEGMDDMGDAAGDDMGDAEGEEEEEAAADDMADAEGDLDAAADDLGDADADMDGDADMGGEGDVEDRVEDLEDQLERLTAEFEALMADEQGDDMGGDEDMGASDDMGGDEMDGEDMDAGEADDMADGMEDDMEDEGGEEESFDDLSESIVSELEKISVTLSDAKEIGSGGSVSTNKKSLLGHGGKADTDDAEPTASKQETHTGFEREPAPAVKDMKKRRNTKNKAMDGMPTVSKEGDKGANLNKDFAGGGENTKSVFNKGNPK